LPACIGAPPSDAAPDELPPSFGALDPAFAPEPAFDPEPAWAPELAAAPALDPLAEPDEAEPDEAEPDEAEPDEAEPDEAEPDEAEPDEAPALPGASVFLVSLAQPASAPPAMSIIPIDARRGVVAIGLPPR